MSWFAKQRRHFTNEVTDWKCPEFIPHRRDWGDQRQILFYKSPGKRFLALHSNRTSPPATLVRGVVIHSASVPSDVVKRRRDFWLFVNVSAALNRSRRVEIPNVFGGEARRSPCLRPNRGKVPLP